MIKVKTLSDFSFDEIFKAFSQAFSDYDIQLSKAELQRMLIRRGYKPSLSFGAFDHNTLVSFTLNGIGKFKGLLTAYDTGTGTLPEYRGQGLASQVFTESIPFLAHAGINQYLLEVLQKNDKAISVYRKLGFEVSREFNYFIGAKEDLHIKNTSLQPGYVLKQIGLGDIEKLTMFWDFQPSWQNSFEAVFRNTHGFIILGIYQDKNLVAYGIFEPLSGEITQLAVHKQHRRLGIGTSLIHEMKLRLKHSAMKAINTDIHCQSTTLFFQSQGMQLKGKQFEMINKVAFKKVTQPEH